MSEAVAGQRPAAVSPNSRHHVTVTIGSVVPGAILLVPSGISTPHDTVVGVSVQGGIVETEIEAVGLSQAALVVRPRSRHLAIRYDILRPGGSSYPEEAFAPRRNRHTVAAAELATAAQHLATMAGGGRRAIERLVGETYARFAYAHPEQRFNDGLEAVPYLVCGRTPGSCVDINTYLVAGLRSVGFEAAYIYGYFFPAERNGITNDMHCWVVTRHDDEILELDIAHHMKAGLDPVRPALNPKPGRRVAIGHSMGHRYDLPAGRIDLKLLAEPVWVREGIVIPVDQPEIRLEDSADRA